MKKNIFLFFFLVSSSFSEIYEYVSGVCIDSATSGGLSTCGCTVSDATLATCNASGHYCYNQNGTFYEWMSPSFVPCPSAGPSVVGNVISSSGTNFVKYSDDATMMIFTDGFAIAFDIDGNEIPNRAFNGATPPLKSFEENKAFIQNSNKKYLDIKINNLPFIVVEQDGSGGFHSSGFSSPSTIIIDAVLMALSPKTVTGNGESIVKTITPTVEHPNAVSVDVTNINFDNIDFSEYETKATTTPQSIPNSNLLYEKLMDATRQASTFPSAKVGDTVIYPSDNPSTYINTNPDTIEMATKQADGSTKELTIDRPLLSNVYNGSADLPFTTSTISAPTINANGTTSVTTTTTSQGFVTSETTVTTDANGSTSFVTTSPSVYNQGGGITSTNGTPTNIDLSSVTSRLDKISNQLTKQNEFQDKLDKATATEITHGIPSDASSGDWLSLSTTWDNIKTSLDSVSTKGDELKTLVSGGFSLALTGGTVETCPYNSTIDLIGNSIPVSFDLCKAFSPMRPVLYTMFYLIMVFSIISSSIKLLFRMA
jgi:hypothetical protein